MVALVLFLYHTRTKNVTSESTDYILILQGPHVSRRQRRESVKGKLVDTAHQKWPLYFSRFYEVALKSGTSTTCSTYYYI